MNTAIKTRETATAFNVDAVIERELTRAKRAHPIRAGKPKTTAKASKGVIKTGTINGEKYINISDVTNYFSRCKLETDLKEHKSANDATMKACFDFVVDFFKTYN